MLTYCTNIHQGESWEEIRQVIWPQVLEVKRQVSPQELFPVGLRLSALAARQATPLGAAEFLEDCHRHGCFIPTINGFPYGSFHGNRVKELAYVPDWRDSRRVAYTLDLVRLLQVWLPPAITGSISTVPVGYRGHVGEAALPLIRTNLLSVLQELERVAASGKKIVLALEPEPGCCLETALDVVRLVESLKIPPDLRPYLGVCFDCCHGAVMVEDPRKAFALLREAQIPVPKMQVSSAARITANHLVDAQLFQEPRYLHQTTVRIEGSTRYFNDVDDALSASPPVSGEWRIHFHLPIFDDGNHRYGTTNGYIREALPCRPADTLLEIETYTYQVLPRQLCQVPLTEFICREFSWLRSCL